MFKKIKNYLSEKSAAVSASVVAVGSSVVGSHAFAAIDLTGVTVDTADYIAIATFLITALVAFWGIKKGLRLLG